MALGIRYQRKFASKKGVIWRIDILQEGYGGTEPVFFDLPKNCPLEIEWAEADKMAPVRRSSATLKLISDNDRQFVDLYTVEVGAVRMDVYRNNTLYWSGTLDTELYEEPYAYKKGYEVTLTFADFACLDRLDWDRSGLMSIHDMILYCVSKTGINYTDLKKYISTQAGYTTLTLQEVNVLQDNFYDEEGVALSVGEVLEEILRPFALTIVQKAGHLHIYDINAVYTQNTSDVEWDAKDSVLGVDVVYNNVRVTFSPYADAKMMEGTVARDSSLTEESGGRLIKVDYKKDSYGSLTSLDGFRFHYNDTLESNMELSNGAKFFQICPIYSGNEDNGVAMSARFGDCSIDKDGAVNSATYQALNAPKDCGTLAKGNVKANTIITCKSTYLGYISYRRMDYKLRINLDLLFDVRYNPFEEASDHNDNAERSTGFLGWGTANGPYQNMKDWCNIGYVPIRLTLRDSDGKALYHYENYKVLESDSYKHDGTKCKWVAGEGSWGQAYLCYYNFEDRKSNTGFGGWATNKQIIGYYRDGLPKQWQTIEDGEYIDLPMCGGYLVLEIGSGVHQFDYKRETKDIYSWTRWVLYKSPSITLCKKNYKEVETEDIEDSAWLNRAAKEELPIETILGTMTQRHGIPNAKGQLFDNKYNIYSTFRRAGVEDRLERLLIGTVYSQYASRHDTLSGTVVLLPSFGIYTDRSTTGKFLLTSEIQDCMEDTSEISMVEISQDNYQGIEYE